MKEKIKNKLKLFLSKDNVVFNKKWINIMVFAVLMGILIYTITVILVAKNEIFDEDDCNVNKNYTFIGDNTNVATEDYTLSYVVTTTTATLDVDFVYNYESNNWIVKFNNVVIDNETLGCAAGPQYVSTLQDLIIVGYKTNCEARGNKVVAYNSAGDTVMEWQYLDNNYKGMEVISDGVAAMSDSLIVEAKNTTDGPTLILSVDPWETVDLVDCSNTTLSNAGLDKNYPVSAIYKINYLGNGKFATPVIINSTSITDSNLCED